jgi:hypothetical protein
MPPIPRAFTGPVTSRNALGVSPRTLGGVFDVPVAFKAFGSLAPNPFPFNVAPSIISTSVDLAVVNLPAYTLAEGSVFRMRFAGSILWNDGAQIVGINFIIGSGSPVVVAIGTTPGPGALQYFSCEAEMIALDPPSASSRIAVSTYTTGFGSSGTIAPVFQTVQDAAPGIKTLDTGGCPTGLDFTIRAIQDPAPAGPLPNPTNAVRSVSLYMLSADLLS